MFTLQDFDDAVTNCISSPADDMPRWRDLRGMASSRSQEILRLQRAFKIHFRFKPTTMQIETVWLWHSATTGNTWLPVSNNVFSLMPIFEDFVGRLKPKPIVKAAYV